MSVSSTLGFRHWALKFATIVMKLVWILTKLDQSSFNLFPVYLPQSWFIETYIFPLKCQRSANIDKLNKTLLGIFCIDGTLEHSFFICNLNVLAAKNLLLHFLKLPKKIRHHLMISSGAREVKIWNWFHNFLLSAPAFNWKIAIMI